MARARITINGIAGSNDDLPIDTLVQLDNDGSGGEVTYLWSLEYQPPPGASPDALSSTTIHNPTITPTKEGTYVLRLVVNLGLPSESVDQAVFAIRQVKTYLRVPATGETTEDTDWSEGPNPTATPPGPGVNDALRALDDFIADPGTFVAILGWSPIGHEVGRLSDSALILSGLPGQERIPTVTKALATQTYVTTDPLCMFVGMVDGGAVTMGDLAIFRRMGAATVPVVGGGVSGDPIYVSDLGKISTTAGTNTRRVGKILTVLTAGDPGSYEVEFDGECGGAGGGGSGKLVYGLIVGNSAAGDTSSDCDYLDTGDGVQLLAALAAAASASPPQSVGVRGGTYNLAAGAGVGPFTVQANVLMVGLGDVVLAGRVNAADQTVLYVQGSGRAESLFVKVNDPTGVGTGSKVGYVQVDDKGSLQNVRVTFATFSAGFTAKLGPKYCGIASARGSVVDLCVVDGAPSITQDTGSAGNFNAFAYGAVSSSSSSVGRMALCQSLTTGGSQMPDFGFGIYDSDARLDVQCDNAYLGAAIISPPSGDLVDTDIHIDTSWSSSAIPGVGRVGVYMSANGGATIQRVSISGLLDPDDSSTAGTTGVQMVVSGASSISGVRVFGAVRGTWDYGFSVSPGVGSISDVRFVGCDFSQVRTAVRTGTGDTETSYDATRIITPAALTTNTNDYAPSGYDAARVLRISATGNVDLTGIVARQNDGEILLIENISASAIITLKSASASSSAANRFAWGGTDIPVGPGRDMALVYDISAQRWRPATHYIALVQSGSTSATGGTSSLGTTTSGLAANADHSHAIGFGSDARGDLPVRGASAYARLALGAAGQKVRSDGTDAVWGYDKTRTLSGTSDTIALGDENLFVPTGSGNFTLTVPATIPGAGWKCWVQKTTTDANTITFARGSFTGKIQGAAADFTPALSSSPGYPYWLLVSDGTDLWVR